MKTLIFAALFIFVCAEAKADTPKPTGVFSNMHFAGEDVLGVEIFITYSDHGYFAQVQCAEGAISRPVVVPVSVAGQFIEFSIPIDPTPNNYSCPAGKFKGVLSGKEMKGHFEGIDWPGTLKRRSSYWQ